MHDINEMASIYEAWKQNPSESVALVTLVAKDGSSYRQPGARMLVRADETTVGTISGGCLEGDLARLALRMRDENIPFKLEEVDTRPVFGCHGTIYLFIESIDARSDEFEYVMHSVGEALIQRQLITLKTTYTGGGDLGTSVLAQATATIASENAFIQPLGLRKRIIVIGAHGDAEPVLSQSSSLGWEAIQVIPGQQRNGWICSDSKIDVEGLSPKQVIEKYPPDHSTAVVIMTHNLGRDIQYASSLLMESYGYIGMLGSNKRRDEVFEHLLTAGCEELSGVMDRLHCPIGLDIGSETSQEIALSILSETKAVFSKRSGAFLKDQNTTIHPSVEIF